MKRIVFVVDSKFKNDVRRLLSLYRFQFSMHTDVYTGDFRVSLPYAKGVRFLSELRRSSIPYELI